MATPKTPAILTFERLLSEYERPVFRYVYRLVRHQQDAEDLTQTAFLKAFAKIATLDPDRNPKAWIYRIATTTVYDHWRASKRSADRTAYSFDEAMDSETKDEPEAYYDIETSQDLAAALEKVKPTHQTVLHLFYGEGLTYQDIADALAIPINTVKTHLLRAKRALKEHLPGYG